MNLSVKYKNRIQELAGISKVNLIKEDINKENIKQKNNRLNPEKENNEEQEQEHPQRKTSLPTQVEKSARIIYSIPELRKKFVDYMAGRNEKSLKNILKNIQKNNKEYLEDFIICVAFFKKNTLYSYEITILFKKVDNKLEILKILGEENVINKLANYGIEPIINSCNYCNKSEIEKFKEIQKKIEKKH